MPMGWYVTTPADEARSLLTPFLVRIRHGILSAIAEHQSLDVGILAKLRARTIASGINDLWNHEVLRLLEDDSRVRVDLRYARVRLFIGPYQLRMKKVGPSLLSRNIATQEELRFINQATEQLQ